MQPAYSVLTAGVGVALGMVGMGLGSKLVIFASHPAGAVLVDLFLPDRHRFFEPVDQLVASEEGFFPVR